MMSIALYSMNIIYHITIISWKISSHKMKIEKDHQTRYYEFDVRLYNDS